MRIQTLGFILVVMMASQQAIAIDNSIALKEDSATYAKGKKAM